MTRCMCRTRICSLLLTIGLFCLISCGKAAMPATSERVTPPTAVAESIPRQTIAQQSDAPTHAPAAPIPPAATDVASANTASAASDNGAWQYQEQQTHDGKRVTATLAGTADGAQSQGGAAVFRLVFRNDTTWGHAAYLDTPSDGIDCAAGCNLQVSVDGKPARNATASPTDDNPGRLVIDDADELWSQALHAQQIVIALPATNGQARILFATSRLDPARLDDWK